MLMKAKLVSRFNRARFTVGRNVRIGKGVLISLGKNSTFHIGDNVEIAEYSHIYVNEGATFRIGNNSSLGLFNVVNCGESIEIEDNVMVGQFVVIIDSKHKYMRPDVSMQDLWVDLEPVRICKGSWIGAHAVILEGVTIGEGAVVGAGAVVTKDVKKYDVVAGVPARRIKSRLKKR